MSVCKFAYHPTRHGETRTFRGEVLRVKCRKCSGLELDGYNCYNRIEKKGGAGT